MTEKTSRTPRSDARANREGILAAARSTLAHDPHASIDLIARNAGLSRRALYGHFEDRGALIAELIARGAQRFNEIARRPTSDDATVALAELVARLWREASHIRAAASLALDEAHVAGTAAALAPLRRAVADIVARGRDAGALRTDIPAPVLARLIEETARMVLVRVPDVETDAGELAIRGVLSVAGLGWHDVDALLSARPELLADRDDDAMPEARA